MDVDKGSSDMPACSSVKTKLLFMMVVLHNVGLCRHFSQVTTHGSASDYFYSCWCCHMV